ncbi:YgjV family protein [Methanobrevibacter sp.]|uniref:YgjV family protein n=1 Tax=Methanobrevibacter sp. TaxID=66852 RepID=UPI0025E0EAA8|nr:YgjV family protein [Methanobrevibacter sp.]MBQ2962643.1 YgjV family protein [Methanobrevibacter sp.]
MSLTMEILNLPMNILIGNVISLIAGIFIMISLVVNDDKKAYKFQFLNTSTLVIASFFFNSVVGAVVLAIASLRLLLVIKDRFTMRWAVITLVLSIAIGLAVNELGVVGLIPIVAVTQITICNYAYKEIRWIKLSLIINEAFYIFYFYLVFDFVSTFVQIVTVAIGCVSYIKLVHDRNSMVPAA